MREGHKSNGFKQKWSMHTGPKHHLHVLSQYNGGRQRVKGMRRCGLAGGRRGSLFWGFCSNLFGEKCSAGMTSHLEEVDMS